MAVVPTQLQIVNYPHPVLREKAAAINEITDEVKAVVSRMIELLREADGLGLAAPQVGLPWRLFIAKDISDADERDEDGSVPIADRPERVFINPTIRVDSKKLEAREEGCLSLPGIHVDIRRPEAVTITALDLEGNEFSLSSSALPGRVWQHEFDHLNGVLIIDKMNPMDRLAKRRAIRELEAAAQ